MRRFFSSLLLVTLALTLRIAHGDYNQVMSHTEPTPVHSPWTKVGSSNSTTKKILEVSAKLNSRANFIMFGEETEIQNVPYQASIMIDYDGSLYHICGGVLVNRKRVLTAAHCTEYMDDYPHYVGLGIYDLSLGPYNPGSQLLLVKKYYRHHRYHNDATLGYPNDIAMCVLQGKATYNQVVQPATLAPPDSIVQGLDCRISGWGSTESEEFPNILQSGRHVTISNNVCRKLWRVYPRTKILRAHLCAMFYPTSMCDGDGGGPLTCDGVVMGIMSWGDYYCSGCIPLVSTRISHFRDWIDRHI